MNTSSLLVELFVEELPPKALQKLGDAFATGLLEQLRAQGLAGGTSAVTPYASPRRLAAHITEVVTKAADRAVLQKLMPVAVGLDASGNATPALLKRLQALGQDGSVVPHLRVQKDGKADALFLDSLMAGATLQEGLQKALDQTIATLPIPKVMSYQLEKDCALPGWSSVNFVRPAHGLVALHGKQVVPVKALGLSAGNTTTGHRFEASQAQLTITHADDYAVLLKEQGAVIASFTERKAEIARQLAAAAAQVGQGAQAVQDEALLDEVTGLVERPNVLVCQFDTEFLEVPQECLILTMKANQKYFPLLDHQGRLTHRFLVVSNIAPVDASAVIGGNERVVRPRLADAKFFFDQDRKRSLASRVEGLSKVVYHNQLGSQGDRIARVRAIAAAIAQALQQAAYAPANTPDLAAQVDQAALLAKADLVTDMVGEFPELQGVMGRYYALNDGLPAAVADAIEDHYKPRFAGDELPRGTVGMVVALADKLETLVGMFGIGNLPTGDRDPFALRRHALGVIRMLRERQLPLGLAQLIALAVQAFPEALRPQPVEQPLAAYCYDRLSGSLREQGFTAQEVDAVLALNPERLAEVDQRLAAVKAFALLPEALALAAANKRIGNILKKVPAVDGHVSTVLLQEPAEIALHQAMQTTLPVAAQCFAAGDFAGNLSTLAALRPQVDAFFDGVMVNAEALDVRLNRQGLLTQLYQAMNQVADLSKLAS
jgi:glycyl-tRNA synthetase beta chain